MGNEPDTEDVLRAYALGAAGAVLSLLLGAVLWFLTEPQQQPALVWGGVEYTSKQDFTSYLNSRGADYKTWVMRHPGAAPWEPAPARRAGVPTGKASTAASTAPAGKARESWAEKLPLAPLGLILASGCALLLALRWLRPVAKLRGARAAVLTARRRGRDGGGRAVFRMRVALSSLRAARRLRPSVPRFAEPTAAGARGEGRLPRVVRGRTISGGDLAFGLLSLMAGGLFALYVALLLSA